MKQIYLDHASSQPVDPRIIKFAQPYLFTTIGNPSSLHTPGLQAKTALEEARQKIATLINAEDPSTIIFTGSATETNNLAIRGTALRNQNKGTTICASKIEHISVLNPMKDLQKQGFIFNTIDVDSTGLVNQKHLQKTLDKNTTLASIMYANNEIGTIQPIKQLSDIIHTNNTLLHVDATAAAGRLPIDVQKEHIDLLTISSNDLGGPQGAGALYIKKGLKLQPVIFGGGQERGLRAGTENLFAIAGMGEAARLTKKDMTTESKRLQQIRDRLINNILKIKETYLTGHPTQRLPHHASFRFSHIEGESILLNMNMHNIQISTGSACSSKTLEPSHVLLAIGLKHEEAHGSMVITLGKSNTMDDVKIITQAVQETVERLRKLSPLYKTT